MLIYFEQLTLTLEAPDQSNVLSSAFKNQLQKFKVIIDEILRLQELMDVSSVFFIFYF